MSGRRLFCQDHPVLEETWRRSEEYLSDKEETALPGAGTKWLNSMAIQMDYGNKNEAGKGGRRQEAGPECEGPSMSPCL